VVPSPADPPPDRETGRGVLRQALAGADSHFAGGTEYSAMCDIFLKRYGPRGQIQLQHLLDQMVKQGIYDRKVDTAYVAMSMMSILIAPLILTRLTDSVSITLDDLRKDRWIDHVADLFDRQLRSG
jgi:hypothetical protein